MCANHLASLAFARQAVQEFLGVLCQRPREVVLGPHCRGLASAAMLAFPVWQHEGADATPTSSDLALLAWPGCLSTGARPHAGCLTASQHTKHTSLLAIHTLTKHNSLTHIPYPFHTYTYCHFNTFYIQSTTPNTTPHSLPINTSPHTPIPHSLHPTFHHPLITHHINLPQSSHSHQSPHGGRDI